MKTLRFILTTLVLGSPVRHCLAEITVTAKNDLAIARPSETISLPWAEVSKSLGKVKPDHVIVEDSDGKKIAAQPIFFHGQKQPAEEIVFQANFEPNQARTFTVKSGQPDPYDPKVFGRWVPERNDDFAWENDRIAYRIYGPLLEKVEPACSGVDVWPKRTHGLIIDKWYQLAQSVNDNYYHADHGEGLDCYKVGHAQGCGGTSIWSEGKRFTTGIKGWQKQKVLANGPIRLVFELTYDPIDVNGTGVTEIKRVTLDAGQNLNHYESTFTTDKDFANLTIALGVMEHTDRPGVKSMHKEQGWMTYWDAGDASPLAKNNGNVGCSVVVNPAGLKDMVEADDHILALVKAEPGKPVSFWSGAGWDRSGDFQNAEDWDNYNQQWSQRLQFPLHVSISDSK